MNDVLIWSIPRDIHARAVEWVLRKRGISTNVWIGPDFPASSHATLAINPGCFEPTTKLAKPGHTYPSVDVLWRRRPGAPTFKDSIHAGDKVVAINESSQFLAGANFLIDQDARFSVNPEIGAIRARSKALQLCVARDVGLRFPKTVMTNDPDAVADLYAQCRGEVIIKSFTCPTWKDEKSAYFAYSRRVDPGFITNRGSISLSPAIYQERVLKQYEVRAFFAGHSYLAVKLHSQGDVRSVNDWRAMKTANIPLEPVELPESIVEKSIAVMQELGIVTGSFDFAVTPSDEYVFFEVNEQGQFLWMENRCTSLPCLQMFCDFLVSEDRSFQWNGKSQDQEGLFAYLASGSWETTLADEELSSVKYQKREPIDDSGRTAARIFGT